MPEQFALKTLFERYQAIAGAQPPLMGARSTLPDKCSKHHLMALCSEAVSGFSKYPIDKLSRWLGFVEGVLERVAVSVPQTADTFTDKCVRDRFRLFQEVLNASADLVPPALMPLECENRNIELACGQHIMAVSFVTDSRELHYHLGRIQGVLAANGLIDVDEEREFSRPLLHAMHSNVIPSFP